MNFIEAIKLAKENNFIITNGEINIKYNQKKHEFGCTAYDGSGVTYVIDNVRIEWLTNDWEVTETGLKDTLRTLKKKEFETGKENWRINFNTDNKQWDYSVARYGLMVGCIYFEYDNIDSVVKYLNTNGVSWKKFSEAMEELAKGENE